MDASMVLCYRDEYKQTLGNNRGDFEVLLAHEWLTKAIDSELFDKEAIKTLVAENKNAAVKSVDYKLFAHCTEKTALVNTENQWMAIFNYFGLGLNKVAVGCCGMAGTYGHEKVNLENSKSLFEMSWQEKLVALDSEQVLATGFSCRSQVKRFSEAKARHPVEALVAALG
jgi:Fe-S oxidoreductase